MKLVRLMIVDDDDVALTRRKVLRVARSFGVSTLAAARFAADISGTCRSLKGEDIPVSAYIIAVADAYEAMVSSRPYRKAYSQDQALQELKRCSGLQFDTQIVNIFYEAWKNKRIPDARPRTQDLSAAAENNQEEIDAIKTNL